MTGSGNPFVKFAVSCVQFAATSHFIKRDHVCCIPLVLPHRDGLRRLFLGDGFTGTGRFLSIRLLEMTLKPSFVIYTRNVLY